MARIGISFHPRPGDLRELLESPPGTYEPLLFCGMMRIRADQDEVSIGSVEHTTYEERGGKPLVYIADVMEKMLEVGLQSLLNQEGRHSMQVAEELGLVLQSKVSTVTVTVERDRSFIGRSGVLRRKRAPPLLKADVEKREFASALLDAVRPLIDKINEGQPRLLKEDDFWHHSILPKIARIEAWLEGSLDSSGKVTSDNI